MSLDITLTAVRPTVVWDGNITHNLTAMAGKVDLYIPIWHPESLGIRTAKELIPYLDKGYDRLIKEHDDCMAYSPANGWGTYHNLCHFVRQYLDHCRAYPDAEIGVSR